MIDINLEMLFDTIMYISPVFIWLLVTTGFIFLAMLIGQKHSDSVWKNNIKFHMPKVIKEEIISRDKEIKRLTEELLFARDENNKLKAACTAMKNIADVMQDEPIDITPEQPKPKLKKKEKVKNDKKTDM